jgi:hypothetical protein
MFRYRDSEFAKQLAASRRQAPRLIEPIGLDIADL